MFKLLWLLATSVYLLLFLTATSCAYPDSNHKPDPDDNATEYSPTPSADLTNSINLDGNDVYWLYWKFDEDTITFEVHVRTTGYIGLGFGDTRGMAGSDIVIGWVKDGHTYFKDRHAVGNSMPIEDAHQDYELISGEEKHGFTVLRFSRKLETCDDDDYQITDGTILVIFAWNDNDPDDEDTIAQHPASQRGTKDIIFLTLARPKMFNPESLLFYDIMHDKVAVPSIRTYYHCAWFKPPQLHKKHHKIRMHPVIQKENIGIIHHIIIYQCQGEMPIYQSNGYSCGTITDTDTCHDIILFWGTGQSDFVMPDLAALPIGGTNGIKYFKMQIHYNNPEFLSGAVDSSGVRLYYTADLRKYDVGFLITGNALYYPLAVIPPGVANFTMHSFCDEACTNMIPKDGINVFATGLHAHTAAIAVYTEVVRNGVHIGHMGQDPHYDFNYQTIRFFPKEKKLLPGDQLQTSCVYDTTHRDYVTWGGPGFENEMCLDLFMYYPRIDLHSCVSMSQSIGQWYDLVDKKARTEHWQKRPTYDDVLTYLPNMTWTEKDREDVRNFENAKTYTQYCARNTQPELGDEQTKQANRPRPKIRGYYVDHKC